MTKTKRGEYGLGELYEKHGAWYGRWRSPGGSKRNRKVGPKRDPNGFGLTRPEAVRKLQRMIEEDGAVSRETDDVPTVAAVTEVLADRLAALGRSTSHVENVRLHAGRRSLRSSRVLGWTR